LTGFYPKQYYPQAFCLVKYWDGEQNREFVFLTNATCISALQVAELYKNCWQIELFFKCLKQHLKIKRFWGHTENAVKIQLYCAIIAYCLVVIAAKELKIECPIYTILQIVGFSLFEKTPVKELLTVSDYKNVKEQNHNSLLFN
jgi:transposase